MRARFTLSGAKAQQIEVALDGTTLVLRCTNEKGETAVASVETRLQTGKWYWLGVTQAKKGLWKSSLAVYLDGTCVYDEKFTYLENFDGGGKSNYVVYFAKSFSGMHISNKNEWACAAGVRRSVIDDGKEETGLFADLDKAPKKGKKGKKGRKEAETEEEKKKREELELLMIDEVGVARGCDGQGTEKKEDFNMVETKKALKKSKKRKEEVEDNFEVAATTRGQV